MHNPFKRESILNDLYPEFLSEPRVQWEGPMPIAQLISSPRSLVAMLRQRLRSVDANLIFLLILVGLVSVVFSKYTQSTGTRTRSTIR